VVVDAEGVLAEGSMGLAVVEQWSLLGFAALGPLTRGCWFGGIDVVEIPRWGQEVPVEGWRVEGVMTASLVG